MQKDAQSVSQDSLPTDPGAMMCSDVAVNFSRKRPGLSRHLPGLIFCIRSGWICCVRVPDALPVVAVVGL